MLESAFRGVGNRLGERSSPLKSGRVELKRSSIRHHSDSPNPNNVRTCSSTLVVRIRGARGRFEILGIGTLRRSEVVGSGRYDENLPLVSNRWYTATMLL